MTTFSRQQSAKRDHVTHNCAKLLYSYDNYVCRSTGFPDQKCQDTFFSKRIGKLIAYVEWSLNMDC